MQYITHSIYLFPVTYNHYVNHSMMLLLFVLLYLNTQNGCFLCYTFQQIYITKFNKAFLFLVTSWWNSDIFQMTYFVRAQRGRIFNLSINSCVLCSERLIQQQCIFHPKTTSIPTKLKSNLKIGRRWALRIYPSFIHKRLDTCIFIFEKALLKKV